MSTQAGAASVSCFKHVRKYSNHCHDAGFYDMCFSVGDSDKKKLRSSPFQFCHEIRIVLVYLLYFLMS